MNSPRMTSHRSHPAGGGSKAARFAAAASLALVAACLVAHPARAVELDWVTVGDPENAVDVSPFGYGYVGQAFQIMTFEFTNAQYVEFLNAVDPTGVNPYGLYSSNMTSRARGGITNSGATNGSRYAVKANFGNKPVNYVNWFDAARVANWLHNGQGSGDTETGAYTLAGGQTSGLAPARNADAQFYIPTEDEWFKAAFYQGGSTDAGYWDFATQSDSAPTPVSASGTGDGSAGSTGNFANYLSGADWTGQDGNPTTVGSNGGPSAYGTFDMSGNIAEWNDLTGIVNTLRGIRGGLWNGNDVSSSWRVDYDPALDGNLLGFRLASPVSVPEPSTWVMGAGGLACAAWGAFRRRHGSERR